MLSLNWNKGKICTSIIILFLMRSVRCAGIKVTGDSINTIKNGSGRRIAWQRIFVQSGILMYCTN